VLDKETVSRLFQEVEAEEGYALTVDLPVQTITTPAGEVFSFEVDEYKKQCLLNGLDEIGVTLQDADAIRVFEQQWRRRSPWYFAGSGE
ncbi:MAG: 3-isopropylmalate dehydratase small subunit, partial [Gammaproteobacteria bacterium]|nr:3-isopropylmalate dehydratase small subunit [Gammaproteobacteria bacterium]